MFGRKVKDMTKTAVKDELLYMVANGYYLKTPTYESGYPLKVNHIILFKDFSAAPLPAADPVEGRVISFYVGNNGDFVIYGRPVKGESSLLRMNLKRNQHVEHPAIKDRDGVPINAGDTIYGTSDYKEWVVKSIDFGESHPVNCGTRKLRAKWVTHKKPPQGKDGKFIKKNDIVYLLGEGISFTKCKVLAIEPSENKVDVNIWVQDKYSEEPKLVDEKELTHTCPDSMRQIQDDLVKMDSQDYAEKYCKDRVKTPASLGCVNIDYDYLKDVHLLDYDYLKAAHLLERQKNLLEN